MAGVTADRPGRAYARAVPLLTPDLPVLHDTGAGQPLLLLHAFPQDASMWDHQVAALAGRARCLRPDAFGCGASPAPPRGLTMESWAAAVLSALDGAGVERTAVAGLSMGGYLALALLRIAPGRITGLALLATRAAADTEAARATRLAMVARLREGGEAARDAAVESTVDRLLSPAARTEFHISDPVRGRLRRASPAGLAACQMVMAGRPDSRDLLSGVRVPTLVVAGTEDGVIPVEEMRAMAEAVPGARLEVLDGAGHLLNLERPAALSSLLTGWLDTVAAAG